MNKLILLLVILISLPVFADEDGPLEIVESTDESSMATEFSDHALDETTPTPEVVEGSKSTTQEFIAPAETAEVAAPNPPSSDVTPSQIMESDVDNKKKFNPFASHWLATFGFETSHYEVVPEKRFEFEGRSNFRNKQQEVWGGRVGLGGEIYLGAGFITRSMVEVFYMGTLFSRILNGGDESADVEFAFSKRTSQMYGGDVSQSLGWMFDFKAKNPFMQTYSHMVLETFVEAGIGKASAYNRINYNYDTGATPSSARESYRLKVEDELLNARVGAGFNLISSQGFFLNLKATVNRFDVTSRKITGFTQPNGQGTTFFDEKQKDAKIDPVVIYALGGGYKF